MQFRTLFRPCNHKMKFLVLFTVLLTAAVLNASPGYQERDVLNGGIIKGKVVMKSGRPVAQTIPVGKDYQKICGDSKIVPGTTVGKNGEVSNAVVYIEGISSGKKKLPAGTVQLDQKNCEYVPHVLIVPPDAELEILNSDPLLHNVHTYDHTTSRSATIFNLAFPVKGQKVKRKLGGASGGKILSLCDAGHPWMSAHIFVTEHPYYAVTDAEGNFTLDQVPPGKYTVRLWQEGAPQLDKNSNTGFLTTKPREQSKQVNVSAGQTVTLNFEL
jgi:hypothetical protein